MIGGIMKLRHPFEWLPESKQVAAFVPLALMTVLVMTGLQILGKPLITEASPVGIVSFEFAGELELAKSMITSWGFEGQIYAGLNLGLDYLFLVAYGLSIALGCVLVARNLSERFDVLSIVGIVLSWGQLGASVLDAIENYGLIQVLLGSNHEIWPQVARICAGPKFVIVAFGLVYVLAGGLFAVFSKRSR
jgi:hypothetical protein